MVYEGRAAYTGGLRAMLAANHAHRRLLLITAGIATGTPGGSLQKALRTLHGTASFHDSKKEASMQRPQLF